MKQGLLEWALVTAFLAVAAAGAVHLWGDEIRVAFGARRASPVRSEPAPQVPRAP